MKLKCDEHDKRVMFFGAEVTPEKIVGVVHRDDGSTCDSEDFHMSQLPLTRWNLWDYDRRQQDNARQGAA